MHIEDDRCKDVYRSTREELVDLLESALGELVNSRCPKCECYIGTDNYISRQDIEDWIDTTDLVVVDET